MDMQVVWGRLKKMEGEKIKSIKKGTDITVVEVTDKQVRVMGKSEKTTSWPYHRIEEIVEALSKGTPVHVDSVIGGSGSSRNQPETLLANLPDIEWLIFQGKKHIVWVKEETHRIGTTKEMDKAHFEYLMSKITKEASNKLGYVVVFCKDLMKATTYYENVLNTKPEQESTTHSIFRYGGTVLILRTIQDCAFSGKTVPVIIVDSIKEYIKVIEGKSTELEIIKLNGNLSLPNQYLILDDKGHSIIASEQFE